MGMLSGDGRKLEKGKDMVCIALPGLLPGSFPSLPFIVSEVSLAYIHIQSSFLTRGSQVSWDLRLGLGMSIDHRSPVVAPPTPHTR